MKSKLREFIKKNNKKINLMLGEATELKNIGEGGNGLVYEGKINGESLALKFLVEKENRKLTRFKAEYFNINLIRTNNHIVKYLDYDEVTIDEIKIPVIIMKRYEGSLKSLRGKIETSEKELLKLLKFLMKTLELIHEQGIIHRDIKPENILIDNGEYILSDFGIASYDEELFAYKAETKYGERLGNYSFSAPEQSQKGVIPHPSMDIYALGQLCYWFVFGETHKGTGRKVLSSELDGSNNLTIVDLIIDKAIRNNSKERYQSIDEIKDYIKHMKEKNKKIDPFDEMWLLNDAIRKTEPESYRNIKCIDDNTILKNLISNINEKNFEKNSLWVTYGFGNLDISKLEYIKDNIIVINQRELFVEKIWLYSGDTLYDDLIVIETKTEGIEGYNIDGEISSHAYIINDSYYIKPEVADSGYFKKDGKVISIDDVSKEYRDRYNSNKYYIIGTRWNCTLVRENERIINEFQSKKANEENIKSLIDTIRMNKDREVLIRL